jgi:hypothetical protein
MVASPDLCISINRDPETLRSRYELTDREQERLIALAKHPGMKLNCMLYRANRLAPLALNLPALCKALGDDLRPLCSEYWSAYPNTDVHFLLEAQRFCDFLYGKLEQDGRFGAEVRAILDEEAGLVGLRLRASRTQDQDGQRGRIARSA